MASYTKEEFAQMIAQLQDSGQNIGACITAAMRKDREDSEWKTKYEKEHKLRQEAEVELNIIKAIGSNSPEMKNLQARVKELEESLAAALGINDDHQRYNGKLQARLTEVEEDNKKLSKQIDDYLNKFRNAGL